MRKRKGCMLYGVIGRLFNAFTGIDTRARHRRRAIPLASGFMSIKLTCSELSLDFYVYSHVMIYGMF